MVRVSAGRRLNITGIKVKFWLKRSLSYCLLFHIREGPTCSGLPHSIGRDRILYISVWLDASKQCYGPRGQRGRFRQAARHQSGLAPLQIPHHITPKLRTGGRIPHKSRHATLTLDRSIKGKSFLA